MTTRCSRICSHWRSLQCCLRRSERGQIHVPTASGSREEIRAAASWRVLVVLVVPVIGRITRSRLARSLFLQLLHAEIGAGLGEIQGEAYRIQEFIEAKRLEHEHRAVRNDLGFHLPGMLDSGGADHDRKRQGRPAHAQFLQELPSRELGPERAGRE